MKVSDLQAAVERGEVQPVYLVVGDPVLAEPAAEALAATLAKKLGAPPELHRRPSRLTGLLEDLRTFSLFAPAKVTVALDTALFADRSVAADLLVEALEAHGGRAMSEPRGGELSARERVGAARLLQAIRLFGLDPFSGPSASVIERLPENALQSGTRRKKLDAGARTVLIELLDAARAAELGGWGESDVAELARVAQDGLPRNHTLVLVERVAPPDHPVVARLERGGAVVRVGEVAGERGGGYRGLDLLAAELERQTGVPIAPAALQELARRTLRTEGRGEEIDADSTSRLAAEYRKLALSGRLAEKSSSPGSSPRAAQKRIELALVEDTVEDRGEEDVWKLLDALADGRGGDALAGVDRMLRTADDPMAARLSFFSLLASFTRQMVAVGGMIDLHHLPRGQSQYNRFKDQLAPKLQAPFPGERANPIAKLHPFRLHRVYLAASRLPREWLARAPDRLLTLELRLKGESSDAQAALGEWIGELHHALATSRAQPSVR